MRTEGSFQFESQKWNRPCQAGWCRKREWKGFFFFFKAHYWLGEKSESILREQLLRRLAKSLCGCLRKTVDWLLKAWLSSFLKPWAGWGQQGRGESPPCGGRGSGRLDRRQVHPWCFSLTFSGSLFSQSVSSCKSWDGLRYLPRQIQWLRWGANKKIPGKVFFDL